jgi:hypothetical protein
MGKFLVKLLWLILEIFKINNVFLKIINHIKLLSKHTKPDIGKSNYFV